MKLHWFRWILNQMIDLLIKKEERHSDIDKEHVKMEAEKETMWILAECWPRFSEAEKEERILT